MYGYSGDIMNQRTEMNCGQRMPNYSRMEFQYENNCRDKGNFINGFKASNGSECLSERHSVLKTHEVKRSRPSVTTKLCNVSLHKL
jgi:hypothetical protein